MHIQGKLGKVCQLDLLVSIPLSLTFEALGKKSDQAFRGSLPIFPVSFKVLLPKDVPVAVAHSVGKIQLLAVSAEVQWVTTQLLNHLQ